MHFIEEEADPKILATHFLDRTQTKAVGDMLKHRPTFEPVKMLIQSEMLMWYELGPTGEALMHRGTTFDHFAANPSRREL